MWFPWDGTVKKLTFQHQKFKFRKKNVIFTIILTTTCYTKQHSIRLIVNSRKTFVVNGTFHEIWSVYLNCYYSLVYALVNGHKTIPVFDV